MATRMPRQDALDDQLLDLWKLATERGMYDAADWLWKAWKQPERIKTRRA